MTHPDGEGWGKHVGAHVEYLRGLIAAGKIRASGPVRGLGLRAGFIIMTAASLEEARTLVGDDPFAKEGLIETLTILSWDPLFGAFSAESSRSGEGAVKP